MKIGMKTATHLSTYALRARFIFSAEKNMAAPSELISQMITYLHAGSHIKPWRAKICMQMRAGRKGHKNNEHWSLCIFFCFGREFIRGEAEVSLKRL